MRTAVAEFRRPIEIGGVWIEPGDLVFGDLDGVVIVPRKREVETIGRALAKARGEKVVRKAIELAFWSGHVWAYDYDGLAADRFVHGADAAFDTASALQTYTLSVRHQQFTLFSGGSTLLSGALRDYTASGLPPYATPNLLFFGDDSSRGTSVTQLGFVSLSPVPESASAALWLAGLAVLGAMAWRRTGLRV